MLVLERKLGQSIRIGGQIWVTVTAIGPGRCKLGIEAPQGVLILRGELADLPRRGNGPFDEDGRGRRDARGMSRGISWGGNHEPLSIDN
jgi:carbon storage regulator